MWSPAVRKELGQLLLLAYPVVLGQMSHILVGVADSVMVGNVGTAALAAAAFSTSVFNIPLIFLIGLAIGLSPLVAIAHGKRRNRRIAAYFSNGLLLHNVLGLSLVGLLWVLVLPNLEHFGQEADVVRLSRSYSRYLILSLLPVFFFLSLKQFAEGLSDTRMAMIISLGSNLFNVVLNYFFIFGKAGLPAMGLDGAGVATLIARSLMALWMLAYILTHSRFRPYLRRLSDAQIHRIYLVKIFNMGLPVGLQMLLEVGAFSVGGILIGKIGKVQLAGHQIAISLAATTYMMAHGIAAATSVRVGNRWGLGQMVQMRFVAGLGYKAVAVFMGFSGLAYLLLHQHLPDWFSDDPQVIELTGVLFYVVALYQIPDGLQAVGFGVLRGIEDVKVPTYITLVAFWVLGVPLGYVLAFYTPLETLGMWFGFTTGLVSAAGLTGLRFYRLSRRHEKAHQRPKAAYQP